MDSPLLVYIVDRQSAITTRLAELLSPALNVLRVDSGTPLPEDIAVALVPFSAIETGFDEVQRLRQHGYRGALVGYHGHATPALISAAMSIGVEDFIDAETDSAALIHRAITHAVLRRAAALAAPKSTDARQRWIQERFDEAQEIAHMGSWEMDLRTSAVEWTPEMRRIVELGPDDPVDRETYRPHVHPDDRERVRREMTNLIEKGDSYESDHRLVRKSGEVRHIHVRGRCTRDKHGRIQRTYGTIQDITPLKETEAALQQQTSLAMVHAGIAVTANEADSMMAALPTCLNLVCMLGDWTVSHAFLPNSQGELAPSSIWNVRTGADFAVFRAATAATSLKKGVGAIGAALKDGVPLWIENLDDSEIFERHEAARAEGLRSGFIYPIMSEGYIAAVLEFYSWEQRNRDDSLLLTLDIVSSQLSRLAERERARMLLVENAQSMHSLSLIDQLTGLHNRRGLIELGGIMLEAAGREHRRIFLLFVDLDGMKQINDQFGHEVGDQALIEMGQVLRRSFRDSDLICRLGGDEFVVLAAEKSNVESRVFLERVQNNINAGNTQPGRTYQLAASLGIEASDPTREEQIDTLLLRADQRMYEHKRQRKAAR